MNSHLNIFTVTGGVSPAVESTLTEGLAIAPKSPISVLSADLRLQLLRHMAVTSMESFLALAHTDGTFYAIYKFHCTTLKRSAVDENPLLSALYLVYKAYLIVEEDHSRPDNNTADLAHREPMFASSHNLLIGANGSIGWRDSESDSGKITECDLGLILENLIDGKTVLTDTNVRSIVKMSAHMKRLTLHGGEPRLSLSQTVLCLLRLRCSDLFEEAYTADDDNSDQGWIATRPCWCLAKWLKKLCGATSTADLYESFKWPIPVGWKQLFADITKKECSDLDDYYIYGDIFYDVVRPWVVVRCMLLGGPKASEVLREDLECLPKE